MTVAVQSKCKACDRGEPVSWLSQGRHSAMIHSVYDKDGRAIRGVTTGCGNWDKERRHIGEPFGFYTFAFRPRRCRNGQWRWLTWLERHSDGSHTLGNRAR